MSDADSVAQVQFAGIKRNDSSEYQINELKALKVAQKRSSGRSSKCESPRQEKGKSKAQRREITRQKTTAQRKRDRIGGAVRMRSGKSNGADSGKQTSVRPKLSSQIAQSTQQIPSGPIKAIEFVSTTVAEMLNQKAATAASRRVSSYEEISDANIRDEPSYVTPGKDTNDVPMLKHRMVTEGSAKELPGSVTDFRNRKLVGSKSCLLNGKRQD